MGRAEDLFAKLVDEGENAINDLISVRKSEELFLDFKRSNDNGCGERLHDHDRNNLAKAISGFGNSEGGVIVWGVKCSGNSSTGDVAADTAPIQNPKRFISWLEGAVSGCTMPPHSRVRHHVIESSGCRESGFIVSLIPKSYDAPHQALNPPQFFIRAGSSFLPAPYAVLAGMFGRTPVPYLFHGWTFSQRKVSNLVGGVPSVDFSLVVNLCSSGPGIARFPYVNIQLTLPGERCSGGVTLLETKHWAGCQYLGVFHSFYAVPEFVLTPHMIIPVCEISLHLQGPFTRRSNFQVYFGSENSPMRIVESSALPQKIEEGLVSYVSQSEGERNCGEFLSNVLGIERVQSGQTDWDGFYEEH